MDIFRFGDGDDSTDDDDQLQLNLALNYEDAVSFMGTTQRGYDLTIKATDAASNSATQDVRIVVNNLQEGPAEFAPLASDGNLAIPRVGDILTFNPTPTTSDPDGDILSPDGYLPIWVRFDTNAFNLPNGEQIKDPDDDTMTYAGLTYTLTTADVGKYIGVVVSYGDGSGVSNTAQVGGDSDGNLIGTVVDASSHQKPRPPRSSARGKNPRRYIRR